jgi:hypothetical protein
VVKCSFKLGQVRFFQAVPCAEAPHPAYRARSQTVARVDVHAARLYHLDTATSGLWAAVHANATLLNDQEHRISLLEGEGTKAR